ncbi:MAG: 50S ribosomal protein L27 [Candidatus Daviesbacteria bacterium GW2011_GWA2_38_24]|uniref:Large ribosomal subunit protein bL27 n=1 Tax=Candidatus Daviesbacteria bacterium GW2011_GWA2_38_24 TaxID=1618422 RepID=A0A0G0JHK0_9BACT|nr:MAG: 50S ribosomal protein L27 [Candidatus Daviesbacteria bacterium GW2011_GWA2_38_24]KKQ79186.1 MAG: 50S ribosomal protein L27 [Candidatus Daviesbacteria bacterium GW2011_GWA1_38_7]
MASKKGTGAVAGNKDSISKRLGVKKYAGEVVKVGNIIVRQKGNRIYPGNGTKQGNDFTIYAVLEGKVQFKRHLGKKQVTVING